MTTTTWATLSGTFPLNGFDPTKHKDEIDAIQNVLVAAYDASPFFKALVDDAMSAGISLPIDRGTSDQYDPTTKRVTVGPDTLGFNDKTNFDTMISADGTVVRNTLERAVIHEAVHGLTDLLPSQPRLRDVQWLNPAFPRSDQHSGPTVDRTNEILSAIDATTPIRLSYAGVGQNADVLKVALPSLSNGETVDTAVNLGRDLPARAAIDPKTFDPKTHSSVDMRKFEANRTVDKETSDVIVGWAHGANDVHGGGGNDFIYGMGLDDELFGGGDDDWIVARLGDDLLEGGSGKDTLFGGGGEDTLRGGAGEDVLNGGADDDTLDGGGGNDFIDGGTGSDTAVFAKAFGEYTLTFDAQLMAYEVKDKTTDEVTVLKNIEFGDFAGTVQVVPNVATAQPFDLEAGIDSLLLLIEGTRRTTDALGNPTPPSSTASTKAAVTSAAPLALVGDAADAAIIEAKAGLAAALAAVEDALTGPDGLKQRIAADGPSRADAAALLATALDAIDGVSAKLVGGGAPDAAAPSGAGGGAFGPEAKPGGVFGPSTQVALTFAGREEVVSTGVALAADLGFGAGSLEVGASADVTVAFDYDVPILIDLGAETAEAAVTLLGSGEGALALSLTGDVDVRTEAKLGFLEVAATEVDLPGDAPDIALRVAADLSGNGLAVPDLSVSGRAGVELEVETKQVTVPVAGLEVPVLPQFAGRVQLGAAYAADAAQGDGFETTADVSDVTMRLSSLGELLDGVFGRFGNVLDEFPLRQIFDLLDSPLPIVDGLLNDTAFDPKGRDYITGGDEGLDPSFTVLDLLLVARAFRPDLQPAIDAIVAFKQLVQINNAIDAMIAANGDLEIGLGSGGLTGGAIVAGDASYALEDFKAGFDALARLLTAVGGDDGDEEDGAEPVSAAGAQPAEGGDAAGSAKLEIPLLESPEALLKGALTIMLNGFTDERVDLVRYTLPEIAFGIEQEFARIYFAPLPISAIFSGVFGIAARFGVGYDTAGFQPDGIDFAEGFYLFGALGQPADPRFAGTAFVNADMQEAVAATVAGINVTANLDLGVARAGVGGGLLGTTGAYLYDRPGSELGPDGLPRSYLAEVLADAPCFIGSIEGELKLGLFGEVKIGFGVFSYTKRVDFGSVTLAQFGIEPVCPPSSGGMPEFERAPGEGLARVDAADDAVLRLHVGAEAGRRDVQPDEEDERFVVATAPPTRDGSDPGEISVRAFGGFQRFVGATALERVVADAGAGDDFLAVGTGVTVGGTALVADLRGGAGSDTLIGGDGADTLRGDADADSLVGNAGDDSLVGGSGNDTLAGGAGADTLIGGAGAFDMADYSGAAGSVTIAAAPSIGSLDVIRGTGGEAAGDVLVQVEHLLGSDFDDDLQGLRGTGMILEGGAGDDALRGGRQEDLFLGGAGADRMVGDSYGDDTAIDRTTYALSDAGVRVNLASGLGRGGTAEGDTLIGIDYVQLSDFDDTFTGDGSDNLAEGGDGADTLVGGGGTDTLIGQEGDDRVVGQLDGDLLDGGAGAAAQLLSLDGDTSAREAGFALDALAGDTDLLDLSGASGGVRVRLDAGGAEGFGSARLIAGGAADRLQGEILWDGTASSTARSDGRDNSFEDVQGSVWDDDIAGDRDDNRLSGGSGEDLLAGGTGDDVLVGGRGGDTLAGGSGDDTLEAGEDFDDLRGGDGVDWARWSGHAQGPVSVDLGAVWIGRNAPSEALDGYFGPGASGASASFLFERGLARGETLSRVAFSNGADGYVREVENLEGTGFADTLRGDGGRNVIDGGGVDLAGGTEVIDGAGGTDTMRLLLHRADDERSVALALDADGSGGGSVSTEDGAATALDVASIEQLIAVGGAGDDLIRTDADGDDYVSTGGGDDSVTTALGADRIFAGAGDDVVIRAQLDFALSLDGRSAAEGGAGIAARASDAFLIDGGFGTDGLGIDLGHETAGRSLVWEAPEAGAKRLVTENGVAKNFEVLSLVVAGSGDDTLGQAGRADNVFNARMGDDVVSVGYGTDIAIGGTGRDRLVIDWSDAAEGLTASIDLGRLAPDALQAVGILADTVAGTVDSAVIAHGFEESVLRGTRGADRITGGSGDDLIEGGAGDDTITGSFGRDTLDGGAGADSYVVVDGTGLRTTNAGTLIRFDASEGDTLTLVGGPGDYTTRRNADGTVSIVLEIAGIDPITVAVLEDEGGFDVARDVTFLEPTPRQLALLPEGVGALLSPGGGGTLLPTADPVILDPVFDLPGPIVPVPDGPTPVVGIPGFDPGTLTPTIPGFPGIPTIPTIPTPTVPDPGAVVPGVETGFDADAMAAVLYESLSRQVTFRSAPADPSDYARFLGFGAGIDGAWEAAGTHAGLFGGPGVVLSTGRAADIPGRNEEDGARFTPTTLAGPQALVFEDVGSFTHPNTFSQAHLYRAALPVGFDLGAVTISDPGTNRSPGVDSGLDLDAIAISDRLVTSAADYGVLAGLIHPEAGDPALTDALRFEQDRITFEAGGISQGAPGTLLNGAAGGGLVALSETEFGFEAGDAGLGRLALGNGGRITFDLDAPLRATEERPLYLYVSEWATKEDLDGLIRATALPSRPPGDLSTDLGLEGGDDDRISMGFIWSGEQAGITGVKGTRDSVDLFEVTIVSEEFPERDALALHDMLEIEVDGVEAQVLTDGGPIRVGEMTRSLGVAMTPNRVGTGEMADEIRADGYAQTFRVSAPLPSGNFQTVEVTVADAGDAWLDTAVFLSPVTHRYARGTEAGEALAALAPDDAVELAGLGGDDTLTGSDADDRLRGGDGADLIDGGGGDDLVEGGTGDDRIVLGAGNDTVFGGAGTDALAMGGLRPEDVALERVDGAWTVATAFGRTVLHSVELLDFAAAGIVYALPGDVGQAVPGAVDDALAPVTVDDRAELRVRVDASLAEVTAARLPSDVLANDFDLDGDGPLRVTVARAEGAAFRSPEPGQPFVLEGLWGTLTLTREGAMSYAPDAGKLAGLTGTVEDPFLYRAFDGTLGGRDGTITVALDLDPLATDLIGEKNPLWEIARTWPTEAFEAIAGYAPSVRRLARDLSPEFLEATTAWSPELWEATAAWTLATWRGVAIWDGSDFAAVSSWSAAAWAAANGWPGPIWQATEGWSPETWAATAGWALETFEALGRAEPDLVAALAGLPAEATARFGDDNLRLPEGDGRLSGWSGDDTLSGGSGDVVLDGGPGDDVYVVDGRGDRVRDSEGFDTAVVTNGLRFSTKGTGLERVEAAEAGGAVWIIDGAGATEIVGNAADNVLIPGGGGDTVTGGGGGDLFVFRPGDAPGGVTVTDFDRADKLVLDDRFFGLGDGRVDLRPLSPSAVRELVRDGFAAFDGATRTLSIDVDGAEGPLAPQPVVTFSGRPALGADDVLLI